ncbi:hypothetical protein GMLC_29660 [Geomonas limicola]|uniref:DUF5683 domain-containing protein n=1 Tax=Geomonas limicola TaxID=2740186 RepID=A0A6V8NC73_9BACT|nr:hypothetical protein [Geomonas limicola]GFO69387.1 hypothetical protein GMLC_29660 [Geomonas limicola]
MKKSLKGALLSALVFPGLGQLWLKRRLSGTVLLLTTLAALAVISAKLTDRAYRMVEQAEAEGGAVDLFAVARAAQAASFADRSIRVAWLVLMVAWLVGVLHAYLAGKQLEREQQEERQEGGGR